MKDAYTIRLVARNEGIEYRDGSGLYRFDVWLDHGVWTVHLPGSRGEACSPYELTAEEEARILPRVRSYLGETRWFGFWRRRYVVQVLRQAD